MEDKANYIWKPVAGHLMTKWAENIDPSNVLPEYPRPQMVRDLWMNLNGLWDYAIKGMDEEEASKYDGKILVPFPIESALSGVKKGLMPDEILWYRRTFSVPEQWGGKEILLHFGAVDWKTKVWINGAPIGEHRGGYYPFSFEISQYIKEGENEIMVSVWDPTDTYGQERGKQALKPRGIFYTAVSGIWQTVWLEPVPNVYIKSLRLTPDLDNQKLSISLETGGENIRLEYQATIYDEENIIITGRSSLLEVLELKVSSPKLWSPESPFLYDIKIELLDNDIVQDQVKSYFGMRKYSVEEDSQGVRRLFVNNEPLFQNGVLDQGYWPDGLYTAPTDEALKFDVEMTKKLGFNMTRKHIKVEPARWYYHCDRLGLIVWQDMVNGGKDVNVFINGIIPMIASQARIKDNKYRKVGREEKTNRENFKKELKEMIDALYNFPCIGMWVPFNEAWGQFDAEIIAKWVEQYDNTRWVDHASGWHDQGIGDIKSVHIYFKKLKMPKNINGRAVVISEYGGYSFPEKGHVWEDNKEFGYKKFKIKDDFQKAYASLIKDQVEPLRQKGISAVVYTQLTDVETEVNGLITYDRKIVKLDIPYCLR
ncbi:MAG TPA: glycoside hydrolase family 2 TIM barrel-domain containing protein [Clostridia bacterium]|nr:glycoside hydrolase family 2 TIM barrel-domain containing protein [Clostridia bacterium]